MPGMQPALQPVFERFTQGPSFIAEAIAGVDPGQLNRPGNEGWSIRDVLVHLADTELVRSVRFRTMLVEDDPLLVEFDQDVWKKRLHYLWRSPEAAISLFQQTRFANAELLRQCDRPSWERTARHPELGTVTVADILRRGVEHVDAHLEQIAELRGPR